MEDPPAVDILHSANIISACIFAVVFTGRLHITKVDLEFACGQESFLKQITHLKNSPRPAEVVASKISGITSQELRPTNFEIDRQRLVTWLVR
jgi:hypothetical protein